MQDRSYECSAIALDWNKRRLNHALRCSGEARSHLSYLDHSLVVVAPSGTDCW